MWKSRVFSLVIALACLLGFSCKVGLGEAVDTVPPTVTITYPPAGSVVRDTFVLAGDCDDDTNVSSVDVYYERTGTYPMPKAKLATVNVTAGDRRWALEIDPSAYDIKDGPYVFYAISNDTQGRSSGTYTQSIEIDNTPPVLILTKPTSFGSNSPKAYGRSVSIEGTYAESTENRIDKLVVTFYDENGNRLNLDRDNTTFNDITDMSNANPLIIAKYDTATGDPLVEQRHYNYTQLYGNNLDAGAKQFYFTVTAYDKARVFNDPSSSAGTGDGNASLGFYKGTNDILNLINGNKEGYSAFSVKKIQELKNGLDAEYANDDTIRGWLETAWVESAAPTVSTARTALSTEDLTAEKKAKALNFSMNPANYPTFTVSGLDIKTGSEANDDNHVDGYFNYYSGTPLNFAIMPGLDQTKIAVDSVSIYVAEVKPSGVDVANKKLVWTWNPEVAATLSETDRAQKYTPTAAGENADSVTTTVGLDFGKYTGMTGGSHWKFIVEGHDISGDDKTIQDYEDSGYGFNVSVNEQVALIEIDNDEDKTTNTNLSINSVTKKHDSMTFTGSVDRDDVTSMKCEVKVNNQWTTEPTTFAPDSHRNWSVTVALPHASDMASNKGLYSVVVTISATNGGGTSQQTRSFSIDNDEPGTSSIVLIDNSTGVEAYKKGAVYYIKKSGSYVLQGTTTDNYQVDNTQITVESNGVQKDQKDFQTIQWYYTPNFSTISAVDGADDVRIEVTAHDKAGNVGGRENIIIEFDDAAPVANHEVDAKGKDCVFRIGDGTGGKYSPGTYGKTTTMKIRGNFEDGEGSGVKMIYYQVKQRESDLTLNVSNYSNESIYTGYFAPLATPKTADVSKNLENGTKTTVTIKTGYEAVLTGFEEGNNYLRLVAVDNVGNARLDELTISGQSYSYYSLNVDLTVPNVESNASEAFLTNGDNASIGPITGTATDTGSGIGRIDFYVGDSAYKISADAVVTDTDDPIEYGTEYTTSYGSFTLNAPNANGVCNWTLTLDNSSKWIKNISSGNINVYANVKDKAGLTTSAIKVATLAIDTTPPTIQIGAIKDAYTDTEDTEVNGNIEFSGTAFDAHALSTTSPVLYYKIGNSDPGTITSTTGWTQITSGDYTSITGTNSWTCTGLKTTSAFGSNENKTVWIMASITDQAGNTGYSVAKKLVVNQNTDRPVITFTDLVKTGNEVPWLQRDDLRGSISDDDGIKSFRIYIGDSCPNDWLSGSSVSSGTEVATSAGGWTTEDLTVSGLDGDGTKKIWLYVKDSENTVFISDAGSPKRPYCMYSNTKTSDISTGDYGINASSYIPVNKDTAVPKTHTTLITIGENPNDYSDTNTTGLKTMAQIQADGDLQKYQLKSDQYVGGKESYFVIYVPVFDNFVKSVTARIKDENNNDEIDYYNVNGGPKSVITFDDTGKTYTKDGEVYHYYRGEVIDVRPLDPEKSGVKTVEITVEDQAGNIKPQTCSLTVDNRGPDVKLTTPKESDEVTGIVEVSGTSIDSNSYVTETYWMIPNRTQQGYSDSDLAQETGWSSYRADDTTATSWKFRFDGEAGSNPLLTRFDKANTDGNTYYTDYTNYVYTLPLYIKSVDKVGNCTIQKFTLKHNPDADRPRTTITYPTSANYVTGLDYAVLGGTILVTGNVQIPSGTTNPDAVYLQIATGTDSFDSYSTVNTNGSDPYVAKNKYMLPVMNADQALAARRAAGSTYSVLEGFDSEEDKAAWWGIEAEGSGSSWYINLNSDEKMNPAGETTTNIWIRACGINANGKIGVWSDPVAIHIDANAPIQNASIRQYEGVSPSADNLKAATPTANNAYVADMFIKGQWYLTVEMTDESSLEKVDVKDKNGELMYPSSYYLTAAYDEGGKKKRILWIPMDTSGNTASYTVAVTDTEGSGKHITTNKYSFNIDNEAPAFIEGSLKGNGDLLAYGSVIAEKDYVYTISGDVEEAGSGFERVFFYFVRKGTGMSQEVLINPMVTSNPKVTLSGLQPFTVEQDGESFSMYGVTVAGTVQGHTFTPTTASAITGNQNIQVGGLIRIGGIYKKITAKANNGTITLDSDTGITTATFTTAGFPYGQVIDNQSTEKIADNGKRENPFVLTADDGDKMPETVSKLGSLYSWDGTIHSSNMPDGPVKLVILAFDKAGNVSCREFNTSVQNNAPRVAKLYLGTDLNGDSKYGETEFNTYSIIGATGDSASNYELDTSSSDFGYNKAFVIKDKLAVVPEIVGGNGNIALYYKLGAANTNAITSTAGTSASAIAAANVFSFAPADGNKVLAYQIPKANLGDDGTGKKLGLTFWDSTEELQQGSTSQNCTLLVTNLEVDQVDNTPPTSKIDTFYWNSLNDNSIYGSETANEVSELKGHIELEGELSDVVKTAYGADDPKVSGKIRILGKSYDETKLYSISFALTSLKLNGGTKGDSVVLATYNPQSNAATEEAKWTVINGATSGTAGGNIDSDGWQFKILTDSGLTQEGHTVTWELDIDTAKIEGVVAENEKLTTIAQDKPGETTHNPSVPGTTQTTKGTPTGYYKMDVVPYVTGVKTSLSSLKKKNPSLYDRTALGHYPLNSTTNAYIFGFNLTNGAQLYVNGTSKGTLTKDETTYAGNTDALGKVCYRIAASGLNSGAIELRVTNGGNTVRSLNNINNNNAKGSYSSTVVVGKTGNKDVYENYYNRRPNGDNNNLLTDDVVFDVWEFDNTHVVPISGKIEQPIMKINPNNDKIGFAFVNGPLYFSMGGGTGNEDYSYTYWMGSYDFFTSVGFTYDKLGYSYGVAAGGDINSNSADKFQLMTSRWGLASRAQAGSYGNTNSSRLESIGQKGDAAGNNTGTNFFDKQRIQSPSLTTSVHRRTGGDYTYLYMAYYDQLNDEIRFRYGRTNSTDRADFGAFTDKETEGAPYTYANSASSVVQMVTGSNTGRNSGSYVSIGVVSANGTDVDDVVVLVWYDATERCLMYTYNDTPTTNRQGNKTATGWSTPVRVFDGSSDMANAGEFCKVAVDNDGGVHIACYDPVNLDLDYAYLPSSFGGKPTAQSDFKTCLVDANGVTGSNITLDVAKVGTNWIPYIGYYITSAIRPKLAYRVDTSSYAPAGSADDAFTMAWESTIVPTAKVVQMQSNQHNDINVALWKNKDTGVIKTTYTTGTNSNKNVPKGYDTTEAYGQIYGNGKTDAAGNAYPILGYAVKIGASTDAIETAQMR